jgi:hypothetical protein
MKACDRMHLYTAAILLALFALTGVGAAQEDKQPPNKTAATSSSATIYPVPNYGGDFWSRSYVTGDWGGLRSKLADHDVQFEFNVTQMGLWPGDFCWSKPRCPLGTQ